MSLSALAAALWRRKLWMIIPTLVAAVLTALWLTTVTPLYQSTSKVLIESQESIYTRLSDSAPERALLDQEAVSSQEQLILSSDLSRQIVRDLDLASHPEFAPSDSGFSPLSRILSLVGITADSSAMSSDEKVLQQYYDGLSVYQVEGSRVIAIEFSGEDPELAARVANAVADGYIEMQRSAKRDTTVAASEWLGGQVQQLSLRLAGAEQRVEAYRRDNGLFSTGGSGESGDSQPLSGQQLAELSTQLAAIRTQKSDAQARARLIREMLESGAPLDSSDVLNSPLIQNLSEQQVRLRADLAEISSTLGPRHPRIVEANAEIADLDRQIREEAERVVRSLENDARVGTERETQLLAAIDGLKTQASLSNEREVELRALEREARTQRNLLETMLARFGEASARDTLGSMPADARMISRASPAIDPYFPSKAPILILVVLAVGLVSAGAVVTLELMRMAGEGTEVRAHTVPARTGIVARLIPPVAQRAPGLDPRRHPENLGLTGIGDTIVQSATGEGAHVVLMTSVRQTASFVDLAMRLARQVSSAGRRVVVIDTAFGDDQMAAIGGSSMRGLGDLLSGKTAFESAIFRDPASRTHVIPAGECDEDPLVVVASERMDTVLRALCQTYDVVILLAPPVTRRGEARILARRADFGVLVANSYGSDVASIRAHDRLHEAGIEDVAVVTVDDEGHEADDTYRAA